MSWSVKANRELACIEANYSGVVTKQDTVDATAKALSLAQGEGPHLFLADCLEADFELSTLDIYDIPSEWEAAGANRGNRMALIVPEGGRVWADARFCENTSRNRGWNVKVFPTRALAIDWLTARRPSTMPDAGDSQ